jgi:spermidine/putrescine transport system permease protein
MSHAAIREPPAVAAPRAATSPGGRLRNPWRRPWFLASLTWGYIAWSILPVIIAIVFSFNAGRSRSTWQGFSLRWWWEDPNDSLFTDPTFRDAIPQSFKLSLLTVLIAVPLGTLFAIGLDRWRGRPASVANFTMLFSFVLPEIVIGVSMFLVITYLLKDFVRLGTIAQVIGLVTYQVSYPVIVVRARLLSIPKDYEEASMDLGASPTQAVRRVLLPLLYPAIFASVALVFADSIDDFVTVRYLCAAQPCQTLSMIIYGSSRASPTPAVNAAATLMLVSTLSAIALAVVVYRFLTRGQRRKDESSVREFVSIEI